MRLESAYSAAKILNLIKTRGAPFWNRERERRALRVFHETADRVPAYRDFLKKNKIRPDKIRTFEDFQYVPPTSKKEYLQQYPLEKLCWDGSLKKPLVFTSTSGSTGEPFYFPRSEQLDWEYSVLAELFLENSSYGTDGPVLVIVGFGMGVWIGGLITFKAFELASQRGYPVSIITPGINKPEIFHALKDLSPHYKETILIGYPPFLKDVLDEAVDQGINLKKTNVRLFSAAEAYSEKFRDYLVKKAGVQNTYLDVLNIYGTADIGAMAWETPTTILLRRLAKADKNFFESLFPHINKTPTLAQYNPFFITFEALGGEILLTGNNTVPLIRYAVGDHGGVLDFRDVTAACRVNKLNLGREAQRAGLRDIYKLPFVYVYERSDFSIKLYGAIIYPEHVREALQEDDFHDALTGKFTMFTKFDKNQNQFMEVHIELRPKAKPKKALAHFCREAIVRHLLLRNAEYRNNYSSIPQKVTPHITFWRYEHPTHFKPGIKQKWVKTEGDVKDKKKK